MASAKPVIATAHGGACEMLIQGETGLLIPWDKAQSGAEMIESLVENEELRTSMGKAGRNRVLENFSKEAFRKKFMALYENS